MIIEPKAKRKITGKDGEVGTIDSWDGEIIGAWERENMDIVDNDYLDQQIFFKRPFKSSARSYFSLQRTGDSKSTLTWGMEWKLPFFMFMMVKKMKAFIASDYDRGLSMLKTLCETGKLETSVEDMGETEFKETYFISRDHTAPQSAIGELMPDDFKKLNAFLEKSNIKWLAVRSYYPKVDFVTSMFTFRSTIEISKADYDTIEKLPEWVVKWSYPAGKAYSLKHHGSYKFLGNAWTGTYMYIRAKKKKLNTKIPPFETYINNPLETAEKDLLTQVSVPIK